MTLGIDAESSPPVAAMKAAGVSFVGRYLSPLEKGLQPSERDMLHAAGLGILLIYETTGSEALGGAIQGSVDGRSAAGLANYLQVPAGVPIYFAVDFDMQPSQQAQVVAYLDAAKVCGHPVGCYGGMATVDAAAAAGVRYLWQTIAWSSGAVSGNASLLQDRVWTTSTPYQLGGVGIDWDTSLKADFGAWTSTSLPAPTPTPDSEEERMPTVVQCEPGTTRAQPTFLCGLTDRPVALDDAGLVHWRDVRKAPVWQANVVVFNQILHQVNPKASAEMRETR